MKSHESYISKFWKVRGVLVSLFFLDCCLNPSHCAMKKSNLFLHLQPLRALRHHTCTISWGRQENRDRMCWRTWSKKCRFRGAQKSLKTWNDWKWLKWVENHNTFTENAYLDVPTKKMYPRYYYSIVDCCFLNSNLSVKTLDVEGTNINVLRPFDQLHDPIRVWKMWWFFAWASEPYG